MSPYDLRQKGWIPHALTIDSCGALWELISYPYQNEGNDDVLVQIRQLDNPETMKSASCAYLSLFLIKPRILMEICKEHNIIGLRALECGLPVIVAERRNCQLPFERFYCAITGDFLTEGT